jgi:hypothetical protein
MIAPAAAILRRSESSFCNPLAGRLQNRAYREKGHKIDVLFALVTLVREKLFPDRGSN